MSRRSRVRSYAWNIVANTLVPSFFVPRSLRPAILRWCGLQVRGVKLGARGFYGSRRITIGAGSVLNHEVFLDGSARVDIGRDCHVGMRVLIVTGSHEIGPSARRGGPGRAEPVTIGDGAWLGAGVTVMPGVTVGAGAVIASGAVVTADCEANAVYAGVPARRIRSLD